MKCAALLIFAFDKYKKEMGTFVDDDTLRNAFSRELNAAKENGYIEVPATIFDNIKQTSMYELYRI